MISVIVDDVDCSCKFYEKIMCNKYIYIFVGQFVYIVISLLNDWDIK